MSPVAMTLLLVVTLAAFAYSASKRWALMMTAKAPASRADKLGDRVKDVLIYMFGQKRMPRYAAAGWAHIIVFFGFMVLLLNSLILWGRGYVPTFNFWVFGEDQPLGMVYALLRDIFTLLVILGVLIFYWNRLVLRLKRLTLNIEGVLILTIILVMMIADFVYEGGLMVRAARAAGETGAHTHAFMPISSIFGMAMSGLPDGLVNFLWHAGFWTHSALVLIFLNLLPYGKHFHVITVLPNVFARALTPPGRIAPLKDIEGRLEREETLGAKTFQDLSWKDVLDFYTCTECGRCTDQCPAARTGKQLSPKQLTVGLRDFMYENQTALIAAPAEKDGDGDEKFVLMPETIKPEVLWACTTCGACEEECPVFVSYIDKIVSVRQHMVMEQGTFPEQLQTMLQGIETVGNPYSYPNDQRADWAEGLDVPLMSDGPEIDYLYWVGCAASFDDRSRKVAKAFSKLLKMAGVKFAILGPEETCNGDPARRAGNEYLFQMLATQNVELLNGYNVKRIVTACPHCYNTLKNEYPDFGGNFEVVHHSELLAQLVREGKLKPSKTVSATLAFHDACYLGRHNDIYDAPREILRAIPGIQLREAEATRDRGMCCGAGGAQMWKEEEEGDARINHARMQQLLDVLPGGDSSTIASACPFCKTMLSDALADKDHEEVGQLDIAELLLKSIEDE